jgi:CRISPR-associated endonuclease Csn1
VKRIFGFDVGTTSIGFAVVYHEPEEQRGTILRLGVRIFPEARDSDGTPFNQYRRQKRMARRQLRRRRDRRRQLNEILADAGLLPAFSSYDWPAVMATDPYELRRRGVSQALTHHQLGRALYHLAKRRHFSGRDLGEAEEDVLSADEKNAETDRTTNLTALRASGLMLGAWLAERGPDERKRNRHFIRSVVQDEFAVIWAEQAKHHPVLEDAQLRARIEDAIFAQRPVFWRKNTLGTCRFMPTRPLCPKGSWLSQQRRMLEMLNNLALATGNLRPIDSDERAAILQRLQTQATMTWSAVRTALKPLYKARGEPGAEKSLRFNLEQGGSKALLGNAVEARLAKVFAGAWENHPHKQAIRDGVPERLWAADYGEIGSQRVVVRSPGERETRRDHAAQSFIDDFGVTADQARALRELTFPPGWEPYSADALRAFLPQLEAGVRFGALINGPEWEDWRDRTFPEREQPTGEVLHRLPSPSKRSEAQRQEQIRIAGLRNPTVARTQNELRKVVNNLIAMFGAPDLVRVEVAREVGKSKREREEIGEAQRKQEKRRKQAVADLEAHGIAEPSRATVEKWLLWQESQQRCPYTGDQIGFDALFREGQFDVEHIWPRSMSLDDSFGNKTLCRRDVNLEKGNRTPFEYLKHDQDRWQAIQTRLQGMAASKGGVGMSRGKIRRFLAESLPDDFASRQLNDTGFAARQAVAFLNRLFPDLGPEAPVRLQAVTGRVTAQLRKLWSLNNILADDGEKTRADHRHHAVDALTVACTHQGMTQRLARYWQDKDDPRAQPPQLPPPWPTIRADAEKAVAEIVVSHRVRKKVSGPLHKEKPFGDTSEEASTRAGVYRLFVRRKPVAEMSKGELADIRDASVRAIIADWVQSCGGDPKKAVPPYPRLGVDGAEIRKVRLTVKRQLSLMAPVATGYADFGLNHHIAIFRLPDGRTEFEVVSLFEASRRLARREAVIRRTRNDEAVFVMSLAPGDTVQFSKDPGSEVRMWRIQKIASKGQISLLDHRDASKEEWSLFEPTVGGLMSRGARKLSVDPIGRIRPAND